MVVDTLVGGSIMVVFTHDIVEGLVPAFMDSEVVMVGERW
jgi:hypothetical protein